jgi:hypothetical protein
MAVNIIMYWVWPGIQLTPFQVQKPGILMFKYAPAEAGILVFLVKPSLLSI